MSIMSYMKKRLKILLVVLVSIVILLVISLIIGISITRKNKTLLYMTNLETHYLNSNNHTFDVIIYSSKEEDYYLKDSAIEDVVLKNYNTEDLFNLNLHQIVEETNNIRFKEQDLYKYRLSLELPIDEVNIDFQFNEAYLNINYISGEVISFPIGSVIIYKNVDSSHLHISHLKGVVNQIDDKSILTAIGVTISSEYDLTIGKIEIIDNRLWVQYNNILLIEKDDYSNSTLMNDLLGKGYNIYEQVESSKNKYFLKANTDIHLVMPLGYKTVEYINNLAFRVYYYIDNVEYIMTIPAFKFFSSSIKNTKEITYVPVSY